MPLARMLIAALVFVSLLPGLALAVMPEPPQPDNLATIKTQLSALADRYIAISPPTSAQVSEVKTELTNLSHRVRQLPDWPNAAAQELDAAILQFRTLLPDPKAKAP